MKLLTAILFLFYSAYAQSSIIVDVDWTAFTWLSGSFTGTDLNDDGILSIHEVTYAEVVIPYTAPFNTSTLTLTGFGDFNINNNYWHNNGGMLNDFPSDEFVSFGGDAFSLYGDGVRQDIHLVINTIFSAKLSQANVPEPSTLTIFALVIMGLASRRFRKYI